MKNVDICVDVPLVPHNEVEVNMILVKMFPGPSIVYCIA